MIDVRGWNQVEIAEDGKTATLGGGASVKTVVNALWAAGKQTSESISPEYLTGTRCLSPQATGLCECVGFSAPILGGGHGWLQGQYGLASDQVISARIFLPSGEAVTASGETNPDLFWALQGAGHNFGIVTEWEYRVYDVKNNAWGYSIFIFLAEHLEEVMEVTNKMMETQPPEIAHWIYFINLPDIDPKRVRSPNADPPPFHG